MNLTVHRVYVGLPEDIKDAFAAANRRPTVWEVHWMMFIVVGAVIAIAIVIVIICLLCFYCCPSEQSQSHAKVEVSLNAKIALMKFSLSSHKQYISHYYDFGIGFTSRCKGAH
jgi:hypothetical protein